MRAVALLLLALPAGLAHCPAYVVWLPFPRRAVRCGAVPGGCHQCCGSACSMCFSSRSVVMRGGGLGMGTCARTESHADCMHLYLRRRMQACTHDGTRALTSEPSPARAVSTGTSSSYAAAHAGLVVMSRTCAGRQAPPMATRNG